MRRRIISITPIIPIEECQEPITLPEAELESNATDFLDVCLSGNGYTAVGSIDADDYSNALIVQYGFKDDLSITMEYVYGDDNNSFYFEHIEEDSEGNLICVGCVDRHILIVKFDADMNILAQKQCRHTFHEIYDIVIDVNDTLIVVGSEVDPGDGVRNGIIMRFNKQLDITTKRTFGTPVVVSVAIDMDDRLVCMGATTHDGNNSVIGAKTCMMRLDLATFDQLAVTHIVCGNGFLTKLVIDGNFDIICIGTLGTHASIVVKLDYVWSVLSTKVIPNVQLKDVDVDSNGMIICVGATVDHQQNYKPFYTVLDTHLNIVADCERKDSDGVLNSIVIDEGSEVIAVGTYTSSTDECKTGHSIHIVDQISESLNKQFMNDAYVTTNMNVKPMVRAKISPKK